MGFLDELHKGTNKQARTENNAVTNLSTLDPLLDFFSRAGAMRGRETDAIELFKKAFSADKQGAVRCLFYLRDIRGGQGERDIFRAILTALDKETLMKVAKFIPEYGRWDEVPITQDTVDTIFLPQLLEDEANMKAKKSVSLLAKWLPSENASSKKTKVLADNFMAFSKMKPAQYRKRVVALRKYYDNFLEHLMSEKRWGEIDYGKLPSQAHRKHIKAFKRNDEKRYEAYLNAVEKGEAKINSGTLMTYEIFDMVSDYNTDPAQLKAADEMWKALPDYTNGSNALVLADVSGSMTGRPMSISVSLAVYFAERNVGAFKDYYMTFSDIPLLQRVVGATIRDKFNFVETTNVGYNTNLEKAFDAILNAAKKAPNGEEEMPKVLYIISDMEFDAQMSDCSETNFNGAQQRFEAAGFKLPHVVFWNVDARNDQSPATKFDDRVTMISGANQSTFQYVVEGKSPLESMMDVLNGDRYAQIVI